MENVIGVMLAPFTTEAIAGQVGVSGSIVYRWKNGSSIPQPSRLRPLAEAVALLRAEQAGDKFPAEEAIFAVLQELSTAVVGHRSARRKNKTDAGFTRRPFATP